MAKALPLRPGRADPRVDAYIKRAQPFAEPILIHLRKLVHAVVPGVEETMKWSLPHFDALAKNKTAKQRFDGFSSAQQREYISWVTEAKQAATRERRIKTAAEWIAEGKIRNWKYAK